MQTNGQSQIDRTHHNPVKTAAKTGPAFLSRRALVGAGCGIAAGRLIPASAHANSVQATPTPGRLIVFQSSLPAGGDGIFIANTDGSDTRLLVGEPADPRYHPDWSPDGSSIVCAAHAVGSIQTMALDGVEPVTVYGAEVGYFADYPAWSPDGGRIAFTLYTNAEGGPPAASAIVILDIESGSTTEVVKIAQPNLVDVPRWSPDGTTIVVAVDQFDADFFDSGAAIATVPATGGELTYLTPFESFASYPDWHPVDDLIVFSTELAGASADPSAFGDRWNLHTITADGKETRTITDVAAGIFLFQPSWTPEGDRVLASRDSPNGRVAVWVDPATGVVTPVGGDIVQTHTRLQPVTAP